MKIIKQVDTSNWKHHIVCNKCDSELEAESSDIKHHHFDGDIREPGYDKFYVTCPVCKVEIVILSDKIPKALQIQVTAKKTVVSGGGGGGYWDR